MLSSNQDGLHWSICFLPFFSSFIPVHWQRAKAVKRKRVYDGALMRGRGATSNLCCHRLHFIPFDPIWTPSKVPTNVPGYKSVSFLQATKGLAHGEGGPNQQTTHVLYRKKDGTYKGEPTESNLKAYIAI